MPLRPEIPFERRVLRYVEAFRKQEVKGTIRHSYDRLKSGRTSVDIVSRVLFLDLLRSIDLSERSKQFLLDCFLSKDLNPVLNRLKSELSDDENRKLKTVANQIMTNIDQVFYEQPSGNRFGLQTDILSNSLIRIWNTCHIIEQIL